MNLKDFLNSRDKPPELYWSLVLENGWVQSGIWYIGAQAAEVISTSPPTAWEVEEELVGATDAALSAAIQKLPEEYPEPNKTVFGVPSSWVKNGEINQDKLSLVKKVCTDLSLHPVGFVVLPEAIAHLYKSEEGAPLNAIILGLGKDNLELSVFKLGNLVGTTQVARSISLVEDVTEGLSRFEGATPLPSRFIVFDGKGGELEEAKETLMKHTWEDTGKIKFLHTPKAEILMSDRKVLATSLAGANEIGDVSKVSAQETTKEEEFIPEEVENVSEPTNEVSPQELGFAIGEDVSERVESKPPHIEKPPEAPVPTEHRPHLKSLAVVAPKIPFDEYFQKAKKIFTTFPEKLAFAPKIKGPGGKKPMTALAVLFGLIFIAFGLWWWFYPTADITIYVTPKSFQQETPMTFNTDGQSDLSKGIIPAAEVTSEVSGEKTKSTTGTKLVGDRAKGQIQVQNGTAFPINLTSGMFVTSSSNLKFTVDSSASVSAALSPTQPGTATVAVTADAIGAEYNLAKDEIFRVGNYPKAEVDAKSLGDFTGGSSRTISAVSKEDSTSLESELKDELTEKAKEDIMSKVTTEQIFVGDLIATDVTSETFDHKVGEEASNLKLSLEVTSKGIAADRAKLLEYAQGILKDKVPPGFVLRDSQITFDFTFLDQKDGNANYKVIVGANFLPQTNTDEIIGKIVGKSTKVVTEYLSTIPGYVRANVSIKPSLGFLGTLPHVKKHITLELVAEK